MLQLAGDGSDTQSQRVAFTFLGKSVSVWGQPSSDTTNGDVVPGSQGVPGFERFIYDNVVPTAFAVLSRPELNIKDGQVLVVRLIRSFLLRFLTPYFRSSKKLPVFCKRLGKSGERKRTNSSSPSFYLPKTGPQRPQQNLRRGCAI
jgi:hypothetical protein